MARQPIVAANWKMHKTHLEAIRDVQKLSYLLAKEDAERVEVVICPAFTALRPVGTLIEGDRLPYRLGAQTVHRNLDVAIEEGEVYSFGNVTIESNIADIQADTLTGEVLTQQGDIYNASKIEKSVEQMTLVGIEVTTS